MSKEIWKKWISYLIPQTRFVPSRINPHLEVGWIEGRKVLDSKHTNYSYGPLQEVLEYGLKKISFQNIKSVLILGMGAGSVIKSLRNKFNYNHEIVAVELDPIVIQIADEEFDIKSEGNLKIICEDAVGFIAATQQTFDLIIIDVFIDKEVPEKIYLENFWLDIALITNENGKVLFNAGVEVLDEKTQIIFLEQLPAIFNYTIFNGVMGGNTLILLEK